MLKKAIVFIVVLVFIAGGVVVSKEGHNIWNFIQEHNPFIASIVIIEQELTEDGPLEANIGQDTGQDVGQEVDLVESELTEDGPLEAELARRQQLIEIK